MSQSNVDIAKNLIADRRAKEAAVWVKRLLDAGAFDEVDLRALLGLLADEVISPTPRKSGAPGKFDKDAFGTMCREYEVANAVMEEHESGTTLEEAFVMIGKKVHKGPDTVERLYYKWKDQSP